MTPITSKQELDLIRDMLYKRNPDLVLVFNIIIETGIPLKDIVSLKAGDLYGIKTLSYQGSKNKDLTHTMPLSDELVEQLTLRYEGRNPDEPAFIGSKLGRPLHLMTFNKALENISDLMGITPKLTYNRLYKTFILDLYKKNPDAAFKRCHARTPRDMYNYLGIEPLDDKYNDRLTKSLFYSSEALNKTVENFNRVAADIASTTESFDKESDYFKKALKFLNSVDKAIFEYTDNLT